MQGVNSPSQRMKLTNQIEICKNYHEHRKRLGVTRYKSPLALKKSLSFDQEKSLLFNDLRTRKNYTNDFNRKQQTRRQQENDAVMLRRILQYDRRTFVFSLNPQSTNPSPLLHHNSRVTNHKINNKIQTQNQQIHFRITKAKSMYSRDQLCTYRHSPSPRTFLMMRDNSQGRLRPPRNGSAAKLYTQVQGQDPEEGILISKIPQLAEARKIRDDMMRIETTASRVSGGANIPGSRLFALSSNLMCDRIRKERLATKLYQRKLRFQNTVGSTFQRRK